MFTKLYRRLRENTEKKSLKEQALDVFQKEVQKSLEEYISKEDEDGSVSVVWHSDDTKETLRSISAPYSIDVNANGIEFDCMGDASLNNSGQYSSHLECYRNSERGKDHDYIDRINGIGYSGNEYVKNFMMKFEKVFKRASSNDEEE